MSRFTNILCPVDFDQGSLAAVTIAAEIALEHDAVLHLLHVVPLQVTTEPALSFAEAEAVAQARVEEIAHRKLKAEARYELHMVTGEPAIEILQSSPVGYRLDRDGDPWAERAPPSRSRKRGRAGRSRGALPGAHGQTERGSLWSAAEAASALTRTLDSF